MLFPKPEPRESVPRFRFSLNPNKAASIGWHEWSPEAFERSRAEGKPILLAISAVWCHWCHVMDETSYSSDRVIKLINEKYIPIRVDADKRPDIESRYLLGGWPTTAILTSSGEIITGGTYTPPGQLRLMLQRISSYYEENRQRIEDEALQKREQIIELQSRPTTIYHEVDRKAVKDAVRNLHRSFDSAYGGFGQAPKFPNPPAIELLLRRAFLEDETYLLEMAAITLDRMAEGEIFDKEWGGFFRYSTERDWSNPHYEKLLMDNAGLILNYLHGYQVSERIKYREIAEKALYYVHSMLADKEHGGFSGSQDADEHFYKLNAQERLRSRMPYIDPIIYTDANASMASAYIEAYKVTGNREYVDFALKTIDFLLNNCYSESYGMAHYLDQGPRLFGWLSDQAQMIGALVDAYNVTGDNARLEAAMSLVVICERLLQAPDGAFYDRATQSDEPELGALFVKNKPVAENSSMARNLYRLAYLNGSDRYESMARQALANVELGPAEPAPALAIHGLAVDELTTLPVVLTVIGDKAEPGTRILLKEAWSSYIPGKEVRFLDPVKDIEAIKKNGFPVERHPAMYPCIGRQCLPAVETAHEFKTIIEDLPGRPR